MILSVAGLWLLAASLAAEPASPATAYAQVRVRQQLIVRMPPSARRRVPAATSLQQWRERRGPRCLDLRTIRGATLLGPSSVDLILKDQSRVRARLERRCPALDYYYGFYLDSNADGRVCADRDVVRSRMGGACEIDQFRRLEPVGQR